MERNAVLSDGTLTRLLVSWRRTPVLPVLRLDGAGAAVAAAEALIPHGIDVVELTATTPDWADAVRALRRDHPGLTIGLGTVRDAETARAAAGAGADFLVSPHQVPGVRAATDLPLLEGGFTPTEVAGALDHGVAKLFPAHVGGPRYLAGLLAVFPGARVVPTGGIALDDVGDWLRAGAVAVGVGAALVDFLADQPERAAGWLAQVRSGAAA